MEGEIRSGDFILSADVWRQRALNLLLVVVSSAGLPAVALLLREALLDPRQWPAVVAYGTLYGCVLLLALLRRLPYYFRAGGFIGVGYIVAFLALARGGLVGDGRLYLLVLPPLTWFLLGFRAALAAIALSGLGYGFFAFAASRSWLTRWLVRTDNSLHPADWLAAGVILLLGLTTVSILLLEYCRFQNRLLENTRALQARYQAFTEANLAGIYVLQDGVVRYVNPALCRMLGYREDEIVGRMGVNELIHPDDRARIEENIRRRLTDEPVGARYLLRALRKDGSTLYCEVLAHRITLDGRPAILGAVLDVTDRVEMLQRLERQVARLTLLKEIARQISELNPPDVVMDRAVRLLVETFGYHHAALFVQDPETGEMVMRARAGLFVDLFPPDHRLSPGEGMVGWVAQNGRTLLANDVAQEPRYVNRYPDRIPTRAELTVPLRVGGEVIGVVDVQSSHRDAFTEDDVRALEILADQLAVALRNAHLYSALQASQANARALLDGLAGAAVLLDAKGTVLGVNREMLSLAGKEEAEIVGQPVGILGELLPLEEMQVAFREGCPLRLDRQLRDRWYEYSVTPSVDAEGRVARVAVLIRDITDQRRMERQMAQAEKLTALGRMAASLAHEINNPLQVIQAHLELALERPVWGQEERAGLEVALRHTQRLAEAAQRALGLVRPSDGQRQNVRPRELVTQSLLLVRYRLERSGVQVEVDVPDHLPLLRVVPNDILQVLVNLLLNGIEAMPGGGWLKVSAGATEREVWLQVANEGVSLMPQDMECLFEPFFTTKPNGTGLGLAISCQIVERYGGRVTVQNSEDGQGIAFTVYLPIG
ncbi:MAG: PAS domain S-box protein [Anaerolineae bacterium]|nr:PAS domain S-box protein [Anaerolineae bacterium]